MKALPVFFAASAILISQAQAANMVTVTGDFSFSGTPPFLGDQFSIQFETPNLPSSAFYQEDGTAFGFRPLAAELTIDGTVVATEMSQVGWFHYPFPNTPGYNGIDLRFSSVFAPGDFLQIIMTTTQVPFSGSTASPTLIPMDTEETGGNLDYYPPNQGRAFAFITDGYYICSAVSAGSSKVKTGCAASGSQPN